MELDAVHAARGIGHGGIGGRVGPGGRAEAIRKASDRIAVAHPYRLLGLQACEQSVWFGNRNGGRTELLALEGDDLAAECLRHEVQAVADAEDRDAPGPDPRVGMRRALPVDARRAARQDDGARLASGDLAPGGVEGEQLRVDMKLAHAARDQAAVLAAEVEDDDGVHVRAARRLVAGVRPIRHSPVAQARPPLLTMRSLAGRDRLRPIDASAAAEKASRARLGIPACARFPGRRAAPSPGIRGPRGAWRSWWKRGNSRSSSTRRREGRATVGPWS